MAKWYGVLAASVCAAAFVQPAAAQSVSFNIPAGGLKPALDLFARQANAQLLYRLEDIEPKQTAGVRGAMSADRALQTLLQGSGLVISRDGSGAIGIVAPRPVAVQEAPAPAPEADAAPNDIVVTAQRRREAIQDIPIAISAFTQESLDKQKIEGGPDLLKAIPNVTFSKSNFAGYNLSIRGIGTKAISVSTDPGVAIDFNSTTLINNRFFEQEFFDLERVEVLRGPQGTLYGRNATGGVVNIISARPEFDKIGGYLKLEGGNFSSKRAQGALNIPVAGDVFAVRLAGAFTHRSGFTHNDLTDNDVDGRKLYTTRFSASLKPASRYRADFVWERFHENDSRARTAKQLCHRDDGPASLGALDNLSPQARGYLSQGCKPGSLYDDDAYGVPNGLSLPYVLLAQEGGDIGLGVISGSAGDKTILQPGVDPYAGTTQIRDRRRFSATFDPRYRANANLLELNQTWDITDRFAITSQTAYNQDDFYSTQDYNRFNTVPVFNATDENDALNTQPEGFYNDPQLGRSNRLLARDLVTSTSKQFSQELRISTTGKGPLQFTAGGNYTYYRNSTDYFVFINALTAFAQESQGLGLGNQDPDLGTCRNGILIGSPGSEGCIYVDPNPISKLNGDGHNYFRSANRYHLRSFGAFGDGTYALTPTFKLIGGIRYNDDKKTTTPIPSQLLISSTPELQGFVDRGYPANPDINQHFTAVTGRAGVQWSPKTSFTDDSMVYFTYSRGYKGGGTNPPPIGFNPAFASKALQSFPARFSPEYVNSFELGTKNTLLNNKLTVNLTGYYYDFTDYQVSQIIDRSAVNENFDSTMYGVEFETVFKPFRNVTLNANAGYQHTRLKGGAESIDVLDRTQGNTDYVVVKPFAQIPSNCVVTKDYVEQVIANNRANGLPDQNNLLAVCPGNDLIAQYFGGASAPPEALANGGRGFYAQIGGNELPNAPHFTANVGAEYNVPIATSWFLTPRADFYYQSSSYARVYNTIADRLRGWKNVNVSLRLGNPGLGLLVEAYVKNVFDSTPITDTFVNSDDTGLPTNIFTYDPRTIGLNVTKKF